MDQLAFHRSKSLMLSPKEISRRGKSSMRIIDPPETETLIIRQYYIFHTFFSQYDKINKKNQNLNISLNLST